ncbi:MAG: rhomboid family intramembrane serine protease [Eubacteriales bacterium]
MTDNITQEPIIEKPKVKIYVNRKKPIVTYTLIAICVVVFLIDQTTSKILFGRFDIGLLSFYGMKINDAISAGQVWRLMTSVFLHASVQHIGFNMIALYIWGRYAEMLYGRKNYLFIFLLAGLMGGLGSYAFSSPNGLGASGAIYGVLGAIFYIYFYNKDFFLQVFRKQTFLMAGISLLYGFLLPNVDNMAHLFGLAGGLLAAGILGLLKQEEKKRTALFLISYIILAIICGVIGYV